MSDHLRAARDDLYGMLTALEDSLLDHIREFERQTGMSVHSIKIYPGSQDDGRPITRSLEVSAQLR